MNIAVYAVFALFGLMTLGGGLMVVTQRNVVHAAGALILSLFGVAGLYVLLEAGFLAAVQILVYIGAIAVLIIFTIMLTRRVTDTADLGLNAQWVLALVTAVAGFAVLLFGVINPLWGVELGPVNVPALASDATRMLGVALLDPGQYALPFEIASVLLLGAMVGAIVIAHRKHDEKVGEE